MKQRITYLLADTSSGGVDPASLNVRKDSLTIPGIEGAKEWRLTAGLSELPQELSTALKQSHELHVRWVSSEHYNSTAPLVSRLPPGLHAHFTPRKDSAASDRLCPILTKVFGDELDCLSVQESFTNAPILSERFAHSAAYQYYQPLLSLDSLVVYVQQKICPKAPDSSSSSCHEQAETLRAATWLDFDFDIISHALKVTAVWAQAPTRSLDSSAAGGTWTETITLRSPSDSIEIGILNSEKATEPEELSLGGFLTVLGEDTKPAATLFSFPARHHALPASTSPPPLTYSASFTHPTGLHPTLTLHFSAGAKTALADPPSESCSLHAYLTLPNAVFLDQYQLSDPLFLASQNLRALRSLSGETDLEAPSWVVRKWGSAALLELRTPEEQDAEAEGTSAGAGSGSGSDDDDGWTVSIPMHLRYLRPTAANATAATAGRRSTPVPWPVVFWACEAEEGLKMSVNPFDRVNVGYDGLFGPKTMFYHVPPTTMTAESAATGGGLVEQLQVPVLDTRQASLVEMGTGLAVLVGFVWVCWSLVKGLGGSKMDKDKKGK